jgi:iron(III) transport system substrate-binding protein
MTPVARLVRRVIVAVVVALGAPILICGCVRDESPEGRRVVAYVSADPQTAAPILQVFEAETGIRVDPLYDTEATKTTGLAERLRRESGRPRADVFWSSEPFAVEQLAAADLLAPVSHPDLAEHPRVWRRHDDRWFAFAGRARVIAFDPDRIRGDEVPATWQALAEPRWRGEIAMADPRFGTTRGHIGALAAGWGDAAFSDWLDGMADNQVRRLPGGNAATVDAVVRGEVMLGLTDTDDVLAARARGLPIDAVLPRHLAEDVVGGGTLLIPNAVGVVTGAPHPDAAMELVAFLASPRVERMLRASSARHQPVAHPQIIEIMDAEDVNRFDESDPWRCSIENVAAAMDAAVTEAMDRFDRTGLSTEPAS